MSDKLLQHGWLINLILALVNVSFYFSQQLKLILM